MRIVYRVLASAVVVLVGVQASMIVWGDAGMGLYVEGGGVIDSAAMEAAFAGAPLFPELVGFMIHGMNGMMVIPSVALALLVVSFFAKFAGAVKWAAAVLILVALQITLGLLGHSVPFLGLLHGLNALLLATTAFYTQLRAGRAETTRAVEAQATQRPVARV